MGCAGTRVSGAARGERGEPGAPPGASPEGAGGHPEQTPSCTNPCWLLGEVWPSHISASPQLCDLQQSSGAACGPRGTAAPTNNLWGLCPPKYTWQRVPAAVTGLGVGDSGVPRACLHPTVLSVPGSDGVYVQ